MIPTTYSHKLPRGLSYPAGAELLTELFAGVPQAERFELYFNRHELIFASDHQAAVRSGKPVTVLAISYRNSRPGLTGSNFEIERGWYGEHWQITVYAVPSALRLAVRQAIVASGDRLRRWVTQPRPDPWKDQRHRCLVRVRFDDVQPIIEEE